MAASLAIGGLRVDLSLGTSELTRGVKQATGILGGVASAAKTVAATVVVAMGAALVALRDITNGINEISDSAQGLGVTTQALSQLKYAAEQSGLSFKDLQTALGKINELGEDDAEILERLGVALKDAAGNALPADQILTNMAAKFSTFADGANKSATAIAVFGEELGRKVIPMLNQGADGIAKLQQEADRLGKTVGVDAARDAAAFGSAWSAVSDSMGQLLREIVTPFLPAMTSLLRQVAEGVAWLTRFASAVSMAAAEWAGFNSILKSEDVGRLKDRLTDLGKQIEANTRLEEQLRVAMEQGGRSRFARIQQEAALNKLLAQRNTLENDRAAVQARLAELAAKAPDARPQMMKPPDLKAEREAMAEQERWENDWISRKERATQAFKAFMVEQEPFERQFAKLQEYYQSGALSIDQYRAAMEKLNQTQASLRFNEAISGTGKLLGAMGKLFEGNKAFAIGQAAIDAYTSFNAALKNPPGPPYTIPAAAAALAAGLAQVRSIMSTRPGSAGGGSGGGSSAAAASGSGGGGSMGGRGGMQQQGVYITLEGERYGRDQVVALMGQISGAVQDGARLVVAQ